MLRSEKLTDSDYEKVTKLKEDGLSWEMIGRRIGKTKENLYFCYLLEC